MTHIKTKTKTAALLLSAALAGCGRSCQDAPPADGPVVSGRCVPCQNTPRPADGGPYLNGCLPSWCVRRGGLLCCSAPDGGL